MWEIYSVEDIKTELSIQTALLQACDERIAKKMSQFENWWLDMLILRWWEFYYDKYNWIKHISYKSFIIFLKNEITWYIDAVNGLYDHNDDFEEISKRGHIIRLNFPWIFESEKYIHELNTWNESKQKQLNEDTWYVSNNVDLILKK